MNTKEAIEKLKWLSEQISPLPIKEAIDTVIAEVEKPKYTAEDMKAFAEWSYKQSYRKMWNKGKYIGYSGMLELWEKERGLTVVTVECSHQ